MTNTTRRKNERQWIELRGGREVTVTEHPKRDERVEFFNDPDDPSTGPLTLKFYLGAGHEVGEHTHPEQTETITVNEGAIRATVDGEERLLDVGETARISPGVPHGYEVIGDGEAVLSVSMTPALSFKEFVVAEHALGPDDYDDNGLNLPYLGLVSKRYGPMIAPPQTGLRLKLLSSILAAVGRFKRLRIPEDPLPTRNEASEAEVGEQKLK